VTAGEHVAINFAHGGCTFCGLCADVCTEPVFGAPAVMAHRIVIGSDCLVRAGIACMTCRDACPEDAISLQLRIGGPFLPNLDPDRCTGCGGCIASCPTQAISSEFPERVYG
jgi:ferredoxin-type protein NapF